MMGLACWVALGAASGCDDAAEGTRLADLEGPLRTVVAPGPWAVQVLAEGGTPTVFWALDDGPEATLALRDLGGGRFAGALPDAPVGSLLRYRASLAEVALPVDAGEGDGRRLRVVGPPDPERPVRPCQIVLRTPEAGVALEASDDARPEAGLQLAVVVDGDLADGERVRLLTRLGDAEMPEPSVGYVALAEGGTAGFLAVTLRPGRWRLTAEAVPAAGASCLAEITVTVAAPP